MSNPIREAVQNLPGHWHQGSFNGYKAGDHCGIGHVLTALTGEEYAVNAFTHMGRHTPINETYEKILKTMGEAAADKFPDRLVNTTKQAWFPHFNDHEDTTEQDVIAVMELAADRWDVEN